MFTISSKQPTNMKFSILPTKSKGQSQDHGLLCSNSVTSICCEFVIQHVVQ